MITQLLQITSRPIKYKLEIERARLEYKQDFLPSAQVETKMPDLKVKTQNGRFLMDTYQARRSLGHPNTHDLNQDAANKGMESIQKATGTFVEIGYEMTRINEGVTIADIFAEKVLGEQPVLYMAFLPSSGTELTWIPHEITTTFDEGEVDYDWEIMRNVMNYVPGSIRMLILEQPSVEIEYIGDYLYFPPSASPSYTAAEK